MSNLERRSRPATNGPAQSSKKVTTTTDTVTIIRPVRNVDLPMGPGEVAPLGVTVPAHDPALDLPVPDLHIVLKLLAAQEPGALIDIPRYGDSEWRELRAGDLRRAAAILVAAESWRCYGSTAALQERLAAELAAENERCLHRWTDAMNDVRGDQRMSEKPPSTWPAHAVLAERRAAARPIPPGRGWSRDEYGDVL